MLDSSSKATSATTLQRAVLVVFFTLCSVVSISVCLWIFRDSLRLPSQSSTAPRDQPQPERYALLKDDLSIRKERLAIKLKNASGAAEKEAIFLESKELLESILPEMMRCWLGTQWDFHGTASIPGEGKIACGYFVSTIMRDAGFSLHRSKLAQQPSQTILGAFVPRSEMVIRSGMDYPQFCEMLLKMPSGIYIVGLDKHVGFIVHDGQQLRFIHASGRIPKYVVDESSSEATALENSTYRVIGNVTTQRKTIEKWLNNQKVYPQSAKP